MQLAVIGCRDLVDGIDNCGEDMRSVVDAVYPYVPSVRVYYGDEMVGVVVRCGFYWAADV